MCTRCVHEASGEYCPAISPCQEGLDQSTQRRQLCEARRSCWGALLGSTSVSRGSRPEHPLGSAIGSASVAASSGSDAKVAEEYSSAGS